MVEEHWYGCLWVPRGVQFTCWPHEQSHSVSQKTSTEFVVENIWLRHERVFYLNFELSESRIELFGCWCGLYFIQFWWTNESNFSWFWLCAREQEGIIKMQSCGMSTIKYILFAFNFVFAVSKINQWLNFLANSFIGNNLINLVILQKL